jgi:hypothetical protein
MKHDWVIIVKQNPAKSITKSVIKSVNANVSVEKHKAMAEALDVVREAP